MGDLSNNGTSDVDYVASINQHISLGGTGPFRNGATTSIAHADFDQSYDPINGLNYQSTSTRYTVQAGDTLEAIAQTVWGDASFWYMIADANGLIGAETLVAGMSLVIPNKVHNSHNNANTYKVYDPNEAIGDTMPTAAKPPKKAKCGTFGQVLMVAIAVAVTVVTAGAAAGATIAQGLSALASGSLGLGGVAIGAGAAALGSVVSQGFGMATGIQRTFSWKGVALSALAGGVGGGLGGTFGTGPIGAAARGALGNVLSQGIGMATGLQSRFNWAGVATAGIGAGVGNALGWSGSWGRAASGMAGGLAAAAGESLITGNSFGDTLISSLPSIIGNTVGNLAAEKIASIGSSKAGASSSASGDDIIVNPDVMARMRADVFLTASGGDVRAARQMLLQSYGPSEAEAIAQAQPVAGAEKIVGAVYDGSTDFTGQSYTGYPANISDHWNQDFSSFGNNYANSNGGIEWRANVDVMQRVGTDLAQFDRQAIQGVTLGPRIAGEIVLGNAILGGVAKGYSWGSSAYAARGIRTAEGLRFNGLTGSGPLGTEVAATFRAGAYTQSVTSETTTLYRVFGGKAGQLGSYWTRTPPAGALQSRMDLALDAAWGNTAKNVVAIEVPAGTKIYDGYAAAQGGLLGGGSQVYIPKVNPKWIIPK
ncbi:LysM repeat protein [Sphingobium xenophagum]|uniref:LysM repeat protein n=1 Tax=Sphingobium xenophagum TaxID=121428 RepID=A0ABU1WV80_SPHXE|nr:LysM domain-containing protein [Sphingobium xenophagum]MDR7153236.1 LysM repeat protein [Sphingobium xenophagum]